MDKDFFSKYTPTAIMVVAMIIQWNLFVTPEKLERTHREILNEVAQSYVTKEETNQIQKQLTDMQLKMDKIYDYIINNKK